LSLVGFCGDFLIFTQIPGMADIKQLFEQAIEDSKNLNDRPSNDTLLQLYSLYKQATDGDANANPPSNPFDFVAKAKYEAWVAHKGKSREVAMQEYTDLIRKLKT
jgi:acyl-CoA-binding protein